MIHCESGVTSNMSANSPETVFASLILATCKTCAIILVVVTKRKPQNTELKYKYDSTGMRTVCQQTMAVVLACVCVFLCLEECVAFWCWISKCINAFTWLCRTTKHFHFIPHWKWKCGIFWFSLAEFVCGIFSFCIVCISLALSLLLCSVFSALQQMLKLEFKRQETNRHDSYETDTDTETQRQRRCYKMQSTLRAIHTQQSKCLTFLCAALCCAVFWFVLFGYCAWCE